MFLYVGQAFCHELVFYSFNMIAFRIFLISFFPTWSFPLSYFIFPCLLETTGLRRMGYTQGRGEWKVHRWILNSSGTWEKSKELADWAWWWFTWALELETEQAWRPKSSCRCRWWTKYFTVSEAFSAQNWSGPPHTAEMIWIVLITGGTLTVLNNC